MTAALPNRRIRSLVLYVDLVGSRGMWPGPRWMRYRSRRIATDSRRILWMIKGLPTGIGENASAVPPGNDDHPPADIAAGQHLIAEVGRALTNSPQWAKTLLVITYDEHGGFFDHVPPPAAPPVSGINRYGPRVPTFVVSPWVDRGKVTDVVFDHTSILKTIARRFLSAHPPDMGERMAAANDLSMVLTTSARQDRPNIPLPPAPPVSPLLAVQDFRPEDPQDFHALLRSMRARHPVPAL
jgi:Phosphoesterase family